jgi:hypothetical protein
MARRNAQGREYPREMMHNVFWSFTGPAYASQAEFVKVVSEYQAAIEAESTWEPEEIVLRSPRVRVQHEYGDGPEDDVVELTADNPEGFTSGELLFKVHNAFVDQFREWTNFFEGFSLVRERRANPIPLYEIEIGT